MQEDSYPFYTYSGLLTPEHFKQIGNAIWLFLWCISSTTSEKEKDGVVWGIVLGNKPHKLSELAEIFNVNEKTVRRWITDLENHNYIKVTRAPYGIIFTVKNSKRGYLDRVDKNVQSERDKTKMSTPERTKMSNHSDKNVQSNKDILKIYKTTTTTNESDDPIDAIANRFADLRSIQEGRPTYPNTKDYQAIAQIVARGMPLSQTIELLEQCFKDFEERRESPDERIKVFSYCEKYILDHYKKVQAKEEAKKLAKRRIPEDGNTNNVHRGSTEKTTSKTKSITGNRVGRLRRNV